jgi:hypothetical protein
MAMTISKTGTASACVAPVKGRVGMDGDYGEEGIDVLEASLLPTAICAELRDNGVKLLRMRICRQRR